MNKGYINEQIKAAKTAGELLAAQAGGSRQDMASAKTLRKRARLVKQAELRINSNEHKH